MHRKSPRLEPTEVCSPEWLSLNPLLSYCTKSAAAPVAAAGGTPAAQPENLRPCNRKTCVFKLRKI